MEKIEASGKRQGTQSSVSSTGRARLDGERGAAFVEFALVMPLVMVLLLGLVSAGLAWNQKLSLTHAAREGARYGATIPRDQTFTSGTWASNVRSLVVDRSGGELSGSEASVCVSLVEGTGNSTVVVSGGGLPATRWTTRSDGTPCIPGEAYQLVSEHDPGRRVQVVVSRPGRIDAVFYGWDLTLTSQATARGESST